MNRLRRPAPPTGPFGPVAVRHRDGTQKRLLTRGESLMKSLNVGSLKARVLLAACAGGALLATSTTAALAIAPGPFAGYGVTPTEASTQTVTVTFKVPTVNCKRVPKETGFQGVAEGVRIVQPSAEKQANSGAAVDVLCFGSSSSYEGHFQVDGEAIGSSLTIKPGDVVTASAEMTPLGVGVTLKDGAEAETHTGASATVLELDLGALAGSCNEAKECTPVPKTSKTSFSDALLNDLSPAAAGATKHELTDANGEVEESSSELKTKAKTSFSTKYVKSCGVEGLC